jgi:hypothetical protein
VSPVVVCPACGFKLVDPEPEWLDSRTEVEELCAECEAELYADEAAIP